MKIRLSLLGIWITTIAAGSSSSTFDYQIRPSHEPIAAETDADERHRNATNWVQQLWSRIHAWQADVLQEEQEYNIIIHNCDCKNCRCAKPVFCCMLSCCFTTSIVKKTKLPDGNSMTRRNEPTIQRPPSME